MKERLKPILRSVIRDYLDATAREKHAEYENSVSKHNEAEDRGLLSKPTMLYIDYTVYSKATPKRPTRVQRTFRTELFCPNCGKKYKPSKINNYCDVCGQKFDFE